MRLCEILSVDRILVDADGSAVRNKPEALRVLSGLLSPALGIDKAHVEALLLERERLQSTGIGDGVAIPHTAVEEAENQAAALLLLPRGIDFEAIDGGSVQIVFGVVGPKRATGEHLRTLARISRLLRDGNTRARLLASPSATAAYELIQDHDARAEAKA
ncbi:MAG TPA: PTS sugar transporter subunit IIA [Polyangiaceae bacterium]|nr:PTS sugar transporter subunit IIA [Polyangiaceae bacterium]